MSALRRASFTIAALGSAALFALAAAPSPRSDAGLTFDDEFWKHWGDGKGELAGYDLTIPRYGQLRKGVAVTVFVTETFSNSLRVKSDPGRHPKSDEFLVLKLNLVEDFATGIYDYNLLTTTFVALTPVNGRPAGAPTKAAFSSQEWCGGVWSQILFDAGSARSTLHSYFDGEADQSRSIPVPAEALSGDALLLWARGLAAPLVRPGERREVPLVRSLENARLSHGAVDLQRAVLSREPAASRITVPAGTFDVRRATVEIAGGATWKFAVETALPHRIVEWESSEGEKASLLGSDRLEYWKLHGEGQESFLARLGLKPRPPRTP
ncbi:MAG: hypothetical protein M3167_03295 [Acidobacteriota bacterium]|nr:hypothetical protein [Acidobacteriota bacterium]